MTTDPIDLMEQWLTASSTKVRRNGDTITACCPAHEDSTPSLSVARGTQGRDVVLTCHAGCNPNAVMAALGHQWNELSPPASGVDVEYAYRDANGDIAYVVVRRPGKKFLQKRYDPATGEAVWNLRGVDRLLYRLPEVLDAVQRGDAVYIAEGEKDVDRLFAAGVVATCNSGGAGKFLPHMAAWLAGADVIIIADRDEIGVEHAGTVSALLEARGCTVTVVQAARGKDASDHFAHGFGIDDFVPLDGKEPDTDEADDEWAPTSLRAIAEAIRNGTHQPTMPTVLAVDQALPLFYPGRINSLFGESGGGKTWVALAAVAETARAGRRALMIDYEDTDAGIAERTVLLGLTDDEIDLVDYVNPTTGIGIGSDAITERGSEYGLVVIDSTGEAMAAGGVDANADREVAQWFTIVKRFCRLDGGPAVIVLDHIPKDKDAPSSYAIGSQRKRAAVTGAAYRVDTIKEPAKGRDGKLKLTVAKDRPGNRAKGTTAAIIDVLTAGGAVALHLHLDESGAGDSFRPTVLMERVSRHLERLIDGASQSAVCRDVTGKTDGIRVALKCLVEDGFAVLDEATKTYRSIAEYRESGPVVVNRAPAPPPRPTAPQGAIQTNAPRAPLTQEGGAGRGLKAQVTELDLNNRAPTVSDVPAPLDDVDSFSVF